MSLSTPTPPKRYGYGIIPSKSFDAPDLLEDLFIDKLDSVGHIYTNGASDLVARFAAAHGFPYTVFPLTGGKGLLWSTDCIIERADRVYVIASEESKSAAQVMQICAKRASEDEKFKYKLIPFEAVSHWKDIVFSSKEILHAATRDEIDKNPVLKSLAKVL